MAVMADRQLPVARYERKGHEYWYYITIFNNSGKGPAYRPAKCC